MLSQDQLIEISCRRRTLQVWAWVIINSQITLLMTSLNCTNQPLSNLTNRFSDFMDISKRALSNQDWKIIESESSLCTISWRIGQLWLLNPNKSIVELLKVLSLRDKWSSSRMDLICHLIPMISVSASILAFAEDQLGSTIVINTQENSLEILDAHNQINVHALKMLSLIHANQLHQKKRPRTSWIPWKETWWR